ncbi:transglutaminase family protein [Pseudogemmobacter sonorensis]|uniref:transglutaminase family protein n=1 Tax=Pseudogemmobacter sonorensis TaxID=2989681 RepID=UPI0036B3FBCC
MRLSVDHVTRYGYERPVRSVIQSHRLSPSLCNAQKVLDWSVSVSGGVSGGGAGPAIQGAAIQGAAFRDGAGDWVQGWTVAGPLDEVVVRVRGTVETFDTLGILRGHREMVAPELYLRETPAIAADAGLVALAQSAPGGDPLSLSHALSAAVAAAIAYRPGATEAHTTAAEALALGEGVCQDHAHALIACARVRGLAARYVSGYLFTDPGASAGQTRSQGGPSQKQGGKPAKAEPAAAPRAHEAAHAWAEIHVPGLGWVGFDPANECCPDERYIRLASGFDARDAAPIRGLARGGAGGAGPESLQVAVAVLSAGQ